jgi:hypothetical protein
LKSKKGEKEFIRKILAWARHLTRGALNTYRIACQDIKAFKDSLSSTYCWCRIILQVILCETEIKAIRVLYGCKTRLGYHGITAIKGLNY